MFLTDLKKLVDAAVKSEGENAKITEVRLMKFAGSAPAASGNYAGEITPLIRAEMVHRGGNAFCLAFG